METTGSTYMQAAGLVGCSDVTLVEAFDQACAVAAREYEYGNPQKTMAVDALVDEINAEMLSRGLA